MTVKTSHIGCYLLLLTGCWQGAHTARAQDRYAAATLDLGVGARSLALGGAMVAAYGGNEVFRYNPAGMAFASRPEVAMMYAPTFGTLGAPMASFTWLSGRVPMPAGGNLSLHWTRFSVDDIPVYPKLRGDSFIDRLENPALRPDGAVAGSIRDVEDAIYLSFARPIRTVIPLGWLYTDLPVEIPVGLNVKILRQSLAQSSASGIGVDFGLMMKFSLARLLDIRRMGEVCLGFSMLDFTRTTLVWNNQMEESIRRATLAGVSYRQATGFYNSHLTFFYTFQEKYEQEHLFGLEFDLARFALRCGYNRAGLSAGAGLSWRGLRVDYAFTAVEFEYVHRLGCAFVF